MLWTSNDWATIHVYPIESDYLNKVQKVKATQWIKALECSDYHLINNWNNTVTATAKDKNGQKVFLKTFTARHKEDSHVKDSDFDYPIPKEYSYLRKLQCESFVPRIINFEMCNGCHTLRLEMLDSEQGWYGLHQIFRSISDEERLKYIIAKYIIMLEKLSNRGIHYIDIKAENIMINIHTMDMKIIDFQDCFYSQKKHVRSREEGGTDGYFCPASSYRKTFVLKERQVYSIGCLLHLCIEKYLPFDYIQREAIKGHILQFDYASADAQSFIIACTTFDAKCRIKFNDLLKHKWISSFFDKNSNVIYDELQYYYFNF